MLGSDIKSDREASTAATTAATSGMTSTTPRCTQDLASEHESGGGSPQDWGDLRPFFVVSPEDGQNVEHLAGYDGEVDIPRPGTHREVARYLAARSALGRQRADMLSCKVGMEHVRCIIFRSEGGACDVYLEVDHPCYSQPHEKLPRNTWGATSDTYVNNIFTRVTTNPETALLEGPQELFKFILKLQKSGFSLSHPCRS